MQLPTAINNDASRHQPTQGIGEEWEPRQGHAIQIAAISNSTSMSKLEWTSLSSSMSRSIAMLERYRIAFTFATFKIDSSVLHVAAAVAVGVPSVVGVAVAVAVDAAIAALPLRCFVVVRMVAK